IVRISPVEEWKPTAFEMLFSILPYSTFYLPYLKGVLWFILQDMKFILNYRTVWLVLFGTDSPATVVPIGALRWYRFIRYSGTDSPILSENRKFIYGLGKQGARAREYEIALQWLMDGGLIHRVNSVKAPRMPLRSGRS
ncbi:MAG: hypothetical protein SPD54_04575, partial [Parabacteroides sp.]|nr:hypothetical protein [Parabacteroides sp.]